MALKKIKIKRPSSSKVKKNSSSASKRKYEDGKMLIIGKQEIEDKKLADVMVKFQEDVSLLVDQETFAKQRVENTEGKKKYKRENRKKRKLAIMRIIARITIMGYNQTQASVFLGMPDATISKYMSSPGFNKIFEEVSKDVFKDLDKPLKQIYFRAINRLQNILASANSDSMVYKVCELIFKAVTNNFTASSNILAQANNGNNVNTTSLLDKNRNELTNDDRSMGLAYLKSKKRSMIAIKKVN